MYLVTRPDGSQYVTDCEEAVLQREINLEGGTYTHIDYLPTSSIRKKLWDLRAQALKEADLDRDFPDRKVKRDPRISQAIDELLADEHF